MDTNILITDYFTIDSIQSIRGMELIDAWKHYRTWHNERKKIDRKDAFNVLNEFKYVYNRIVVQNVSDDIILKKHEWNKNTL
jgi:hypothetical protein